MAPPTPQNALGRAYIERRTAERFEMDAAGIVGHFGRLVGKARLLSAVIEVGLNHPDEVIAVLEAEASKA